MKILAVAIPKRRRTIYESKEKNKKRKKQHRELTMEISCRAIFLFNFFPTFNSSIAFLSLFSFQSLKSIFFSEYAIFSSSSNTYIYGCVCEYISVCMCVC